VKPIQALATVLAFAVAGFAQRTGAGSGHASAPAPRPAPVVKAQPAAPQASARIATPSAGIATPGTGINQMKPVYGHNGYRRFHPGGTVILYAYAYPVFIGGYADYGYAAYPDSGYATDPGTGPQVIMNDNYVPERANPVMHDYTEESSGVQSFEAPGRESLSNSSDDGTDYYLIAFKDHSIYSAFAYWVENDTLHYVTPQRVHNQVSLALVDRQLTDKLNSGRMQVKLPN